MTAPNLSTLWAEVLIEEAARAGLDRVVIAPGSRSTPLTVAADQHPALDTETHLDERSAGFYTLGIGKRTGSPAALVSTSGTAAVNFHPAVVEAHQSRTPLVVLTADRPPELQDSGANQTIDQRELYGSATRFDRTLPTPDPADRSLRSLRTTVDRALAAAEPPNPGPVHLNVPLRKPLAPVEDSTALRGPLPETGPGKTGLDGPFVRTHAGTVSPSDDAVAELRTAIEQSERGLLVAGPLAPDPARRDALYQLARETGVPLLADPLSNLRYGREPPELILGGYDGYLGTAGTAAWPDPDLVIRVGASPTSKPLRHWLRDADTRQFVIDPAGGWREATFTATDRLQTSIPALVEALGDVDAAVRSGWTERFRQAEAVHQAAVADVDAPGWEGGVLHQVVAAAPDPATVFVSNSMPVRDLDRYGHPREADLTVLGNRGASGIDGIASTALGAGSATSDPLIAITGDLAYFHDMNGLLALGRFGLDATIVLLNNDGGGIFHKLPIADFDPPFERQFKTPHGLDFEATEALYELDFDRVEPAEIGAAVAASTTAPGTQVLEVRTDAERSQQIRERLRETVGNRLADHE
ncbi:2-succinyl-5-enolpyruvyl-6-hydroxy-3-cyclohexene-1-carboxylic-acid synthase [Halodesulfurarchaeum sp. HSR-GB]|uniref:2-succinyl-5-enolpyruvyl-6-hydroxy-3- cyclohexene-1-carboxylic-acid synthase n=1 Tax=Halodesulfurarchaeum sp. HSR-GB TaxID=3074077 RepID=UPI00285F7604|nr:2-succinyl-5-enolpyruvyl-6-hydroxy-3-cyclohexene-1-carboxylic-acid synthase [Halodesulfurarchaeum sp. HSR-GB]MDR5656936.1 2-succinyl-5-enolpyruvyl-6-hydroxy-3-cyclohexene-1-carboxylic-acid synthase [Halodesulfurarchaeum sp. HSR-GB]